ncbi:MAG: hypothetical protein WDO13_00025 [Verrucomicrobiota bacterium]
MSDEPDIIEFLRQTVERGGSDLHLCAGSQAMVRLHGDLVPVSEQVLDSDTAASSSTASSRRASARASRRAGSSTSRST